MMTRSLIAVVIASLFVPVPTARAQEPDELELEKIPQAVMDALRTRFPNAEIQQWTKEKEGDITVYDFEFLIEGRKFEADIKEDGAIHNWEKEIALADLPDTVRQTADSKYPRARVIEIMAITAVDGGQEMLEGYEIVLKTADQKTIELTVAPDGEILEEDTEEGG